MYENTGSFDDLYDDLSHFHGDDDSKAGGSLRQSRRRSRVVATSRQHRPPSLAPLPAQADDHANLQARANADPPDGQDPLPRYLCPSAYPDDQKPTEIVCLLLGRRGLKPRHLPPPAGRGRAPYVQQPLFALCRALFSPARAPRERRRVGQRGSGVLRRLVGRARGRRPQGR